MRLYLVQHAKAHTKEENQERTINEVGRSETNKVGLYYNKLIWNKPEKIVHSSKLRAKETAEILGSYLNAPNGIEEEADLDPMADPRIWVTKLRRIETDLMIVGHLPHLAKLTSILLTGNSDNQTVKFYNSGIVCLEKVENSWLVQWITIPENIVGE
ncbi:MAG: phosphohistidine phosphatase SixA [Candidatus Kariarchaeaceae archaeon]